MDFNKRYSDLNDAQKQAVDCIDGPVMVIAGPGTGKTELLGVRVANIMQKTDTLPENILCLTFTDSGANKMRERLTEIIGRDAYKVAIHTFHSFGTEIINQNGQFFFNGAHFKPADNASSYEVIKKIFDGLDYNNPLVSKMNGEYTHQNDALKVISELKKSGFSSDELLKVLDDNDEAIFNIEKLLSPIFNNKISKLTAVEAVKCIPKIQQLSDNSKLHGITPLAKIISESLGAACNIAISTGKTPAITSWRNDWFEKDKSNNFVLKSRNRQIKLRAIIRIYDEYLFQMQSAEIFDFDDMILQVIKAVEENDDLRFNLQEKYQYILVDEFQDTNMAQMRILRNLTNNEVQGDTPNIMIVGDDDQAIYSFQGAEVSNIIDFQKFYPKAQQITLTENYRSVAQVLDNSRDVIIQGKGRLEDQFDNIDKRLHSNKDYDGKINIYKTDTIIDERYWIAKNIKSQIDAGKKPNEIAIIARHHKEIVNLLPYLNHFNILANYERQDNALEQDVIILIEKISKLLINIASNDHDSANAILPQILSHSAFGYKPIDIWNLSIKSYDNHARWLDTMATIPVFIPIYNFIINLSSTISNLPLEKVLDIIIGNPNQIIADKPDAFISPIYEYYFSKQQMTDDPNTYLTYLESLRAIRTKLRDYNPDSAPTLATFVSYIELCKKVGEIICISRATTTSENAINVMTAHKAKGQEFDTVYIINAVDTVWGEHSRGHARLINYPENLHLMPAGETSDERLRLFYVAMTRAKNELNISFSAENDKRKETMLADFLVESKIEQTKITSDDSTDKLVEITEIDWHQPIVSPITDTMQNLLLPRLADYKLSVTHLQNFLNVKNGGPETFLLNNLLQFPQEKSPSACFGTAIHDVLQFAHTHFASTRDKLPITELQSKFDSILAKQHLSSDDFSFMQKRGHDVIQTYFDKQYDTFTVNQLSELNFNNQHCIVENAHLSGKLDLVDIDNSAKSISVTDYKTGKQHYSWKGDDDNAKIKLHNYKQQLMFYKLLIENSRDYNKYSVNTGTMQFVEPTPTGEILSINTDFSDSEMTEFTKLINAAWDHITKLDLPDVSGYDASFKGILAFEQDLIDDII